MFIRAILPFALLFSASLFAQERRLLSVQRAEVSFVSDAPMERIAASNSKATGLLDPAARQFAVKIPIADFEGFNSPLQREHFNENYMATATWPHATFQGRIIEAVDLTVPGEHSVRAKGAFTIRGVERERIVPCRVVVSNEGVRVTATLDVALEDHGIRIPRVVQQKIAAVVDVKVDALFKPSASKP